MIVKDNNGTVFPIWKRYLEGVFNVSNVTLDYDTDKILDGPTKKNWEAT